MRERVIEAMAEAIHTEDPAYAPPYWSDCTDDMKWFYRKQAGVALDALVGFLRANADEIVDGHPSVVVVRRVQLGKVLDVLVDVEAG